MNVSNIVILNNTYEYEEYCVDEVKTTIVFYYFLRQKFPLATIDICADNKYIDYINESCTMKEGDSILKRTSMGKRLGNESIDHSFISDYDIEGIDFYGLYYDLIFIVPYNLCNRFLIKDLKTLFPYANHKNTFAIPNYNRNLTGYKFTSGIGNKHLGLFIDKYSEISSEKFINDPLVIANIDFSDEIVSDDFDFDNGDYFDPDYEVISDAYSFIEKAAEKYKYKRLVVLCNLDVYDESMFTFENNEHYTKVIHVRNQLEFDSIEDNNENTIILRYDLDKLPRQHVLNCIVNSVDDIYLSEGQFITDVLTFAPKKNIVFQRVTKFKELISSIKNLEQDKIVNYNFFDKFDDVLNRYVINE